MTELRDARADGDYFDGIVARATDLCQSAEKRLERPADQWRTPESFAMAAGDALKPYWNLFSARYSQGAPVVELRSVFDDVLFAAERAVRLEQEHFSPDLVALQFKNPKIKDYYREWLLLVSLALAFQVDEEVFDRVVAAVKFGWGDSLIDRLIAVRRPSHPIGTGLFFPKLVGALNDVFGSQDPSLSIGRYLSKWYATWKGIEGWGGHERLPKPAYFGYWAFETIGVVAALEIDDSSFRGSEYYPRDLASSQAENGTG